MQIAACKNETTYHLYLDLKKAYHSIDRDKTLEVMRKYGVEPRICRYVKETWNEQMFLLRQAGFYSEPIDVQRGCTQGDIDSPVIFNLVVDAVIRAAKAERDYGKTRLCFYADNGLLENKVPSELQRDLDLIVDLFERMGLRTNQMKTKFMVVRGTQALTARSQET